MSVKDRGMVRSARAKAATVVVAGALLAVVAAAGSPAPSLAASPATGKHGDPLGLPPLSSAASYNLAPSSRTVVPKAVHASTPVNTDYVTASSPTSERDAHDLRADSSSSTTKLDGTTVRQAGKGVAAASFSYLMHTAGGHQVSLRVEEDGSASSDYDVLVDGTPVYHRTPSDAFGAGRPIGLVHYSVTVPARLVKGDTFRVEFRNRDKPGDGARIAGVWSTSDGGHATAPYGGRVTQPSGAIAGGTTTLSSDIFGRPYVVYDFGREVGGTVRVDVDNTGGAPKVGLAYSESKQFLTTTSDFSQDPSGVATETHYFDPDPGASTIDDPVIRGWLPLPHGLPRGPRLGAALGPEPALHRGPGQHGPA